MGITDWIAGNEPHMGLDAALVAWPRMLKQAGYTTALIGKWHLGVRDEQHPSRFGYHLITTCLDRPPDHKPDD